MNTTLDLIVFIVGLITAYWGSKIWNDAIQLLETKHKELILKQKMASPVLLILIFSPLILGSFLMDNYKSYTLEIAVAQVAYVICLCIVQYLLTYWRLKSYKVPKSLIEKYNTAVTFGCIGAFIIISIPFFRLVQKYG